MVDEKELIKMLNTRLVAEQGNPAAEKLITMCLEAVDELINIKKKEN